ncbi:hypothetical protein LCGC14_1319260 [marine sediment metagenome]|uniref:Uncharacterized protein n=1 Tax=marine sediment metagenome TaxID=412755 RepID=A0A0F9NM97_9ZZZZ
MKECPFFETFPGHFDGHPVALDTYPPWFGGCPDFSGIPDG